MPDAPPPTSPLSGNSQEKPAAPGSAWDRMHRLDTQLTHVWMVRTFLKHSEETEEDPQIMEVVRVLYDYCLAVGPAWNAQDAELYFKTAGKKLPRLRRACEDFRVLLPRVSTHTNFKMALASLTAAVEEVTTLLVPLSH